MLLYHCKVAIEVCREKTVKGENECVFDIKVCFVLNGNSEMLCASCSGRFIQERDASRGNLPVSTFEPGITSEYLYGKDKNGNTIFYGVRMVVGENRQRDYGGRVSQNRFNHSTGDNEAVFVGTYEKMNGVHGTLNHDTNKWTALPPSRPSSN